MPTSSAGEAQAHPGQYGDSLAATKLYGDILHMVLQLLDVNSRAACALVCRAWCEPAARLIWTHLEYKGARPLYNILLPVDLFFWPKDGWAPYYREASPIHPPLTLSQPLRSRKQQIVATKPYTDPQRWERFLLRSSHVRVLAFGEWVEDEASLIEALIAHNGGTTFLPNVQKMSLEKGLEHAAVLELLVPSRLRVLYLNGCRVPASERWREFEKLSCAVPSLTWLASEDSFWGELSASSVVHENSGALFRRLQKLELPRLAVAPDAIAHLMTLPELEYLECTLGPSPSKGREHSIIMAPSLKTLNLFCQNLPTPISDFLSRLRAPCLTEMTLDMKIGHFSSADIATIYRHLAGIPTTNSLQQLRVDMRCKGARGRSTAALGDILRPLFSQSRMRRLCASFTFYTRSCVLTFADGDLRAMLEAWGHLQHLDIALPSLESVPLPAGLTVLKHVAQHNPFLTTLEVPVDILPEPISLPTQPPLPPHPLARLRFEVRRFDPHVQPDQMALLIDTLFPRLVLDDRYERPVIGLVPESEQCWLGVLRELRRLQAERRGEPADE